MNTQTCRRRAVVLVCGGYRRFGRVDDVAGAAGAVERSFKACGFDVAVEEDADSGAIARRVAEALDPMTANDVTIVYFCGFASNVNGVVRVFPSDEDESSLGGRTSLCASHYVAVTAKRVARVSWCRFAACGAGASDSLSVADVIETYRRQRLSSRRGVAVGTVVVIVDGATSALSEAVDKHRLESAVAALDIPSAGVGSNQLQWCLLCTLIPAASRHRHSRFHRCTGVTSRVCGSLTQSMLWCLGDRGREVPGSLPHVNVEHDPPGSVRVGSLLTAVPQCVCGCAGATMVLSSLQRNVLMPPPPLPW